MPLAGNFTGDVQIGGVLSLRGPLNAPGAIPASAIMALAGLEASKLEHQFQQAGCQDQIAVAERRVIHVVYGATGDVIAFKAGSVVPCTGDATISVDLHVNGASVLTAPIELDSADVAYVPVAGVVNTAELAADDVLEVVITVDAGTGTLGRGVFWLPVLREDAQ